MPKQRMKNQSEPPDLKNEIRKKIYRRFGLPGLIILTLLTAAITVFTVWEKMAHIPGASSLVDFITRERLPKADPRRFSVMVARLEKEKDDKREHVQAIVDQLEQFKGIEVLKLDRTIPLAGSKPEEMVRRGEAQARKFLRKSGASVLIWGMVLSPGGSPYYKLYWTSLKPEEGGREARRYSAQQGLPKEFWEDLAKILRSLVDSGYAEFAAQEVHPGTDPLPPFIARVQKLLEGSKGWVVGWDGEARGATLVVLGKALSTLSKQSGKGQPGEEALARLVDYLQQELKEYGSEGDPCKLGIIKSNLGDIQWSLGEREGSAARSAARLEKGVDFYREASKEWARAREPQERARTQRTLGIALRKLGERERGAARLEEAVTVCREALKVLTRERFPLEWAQTQYHLGMALMRLGERVGDTIRLEEAVAAFKAALEVFEAEEETEFIKLTQDSLSRVEKLLRERRK